MPDGFNTNPFCAADQLTLADLMTEVQADPSLTNQRRRNIRSSLRAVAQDHR